MGADFTTFYIHILRKAFNPSVLHFFLCKREMVIETSAPLGVFVKGKQVNIHDSLEHCPGT